jgi:hypothetical protein
MNLSWQAAMLVLVAGGLGMSVPVQGGFGAYHLLVMEGLALYGVDRDHGLSFATTGAFHPGYTCHPVGRAFSAPAGAFKKKYFG